MREPRQHWVAALKAACGSDHDLRWNDTVGRWEFIIPGADGVPRSQFWGWFYTKHADGSRTPLAPNPASGLHDFREMDDESMAEAIDNLTRTFLGNAFDGTGNTRREVLTRYRWNRDERKRRFDVAGQAFANHLMDNGRKIRGNPLIHLPAHLGAAQSA